MNSISRFGTLFVFTPSHHQVSRPNTARVFLFYSYSMVICFFALFSYLAFLLNPLYSDRSVFPFFCCKGIFVISLIKVGPLVSLKISTPLFSQVVFLE